MRFVDACAGGLRHRLELARRYDTLTASESELTRLGLRRGRHPGGDAARLLARSLNAVIEGVFAHRGIFVRAAPDRFSRREHFPLCKSGKRLL